MTPDDDPLSFPVLLASASELLSKNGYRVARDLDLEALPRERALLAEDDYSVVAIAIYDTWGQLEGEWAEAQAELVGLLSRRLARTAPKAWDGYLVLLCAGVAPNAVAISKIERDTTRVRKIIGTSETLRTTSDIERMLELLMPLRLPEMSVDMEDPLELLLNLLKGQVDRRALRVVIDAYRKLEPLLERLHSLESSNET